MPIDMSQKQQPEMRLPLNSNWWDLKPPLRPEDFSQHQLGLRGPQGLHSQHRAVSRQGNQNAKAQAAALLLQFNLAIAWIDWKNRLNRLMFVR